MASRGANVADDAEPTAAAAALAQLRAHTNKACDLLSKLHFWRAAEVFSRAVAAAQALRHEDCLLVARSQILRADALVHHSGLPTLSPADVAAAHSEAFDVLLPAAMATLHRRRVAGTLLPGALRAHETSFWLAGMQRDAAQRGGVIAQPAVKVQLCGYLLVMQAAKLAVYCIMHMSVAQYDARGDALLSFVADALELLVQRRTAPGALEWHATEAGLLNMVHTLVQAEPAAAPGAPRSRGLTRVMAVWAHVEASGMMRHPQFRERVSAQMTSTAARGATADRAAESGARRTCALESCGAREVHASQFKLCGACKSVCYCSAEHQAAHWRDHKAACKAARKAAAAASGAGADDAGGSARR
jgi:hypothetical protein